MRNYADMTVCAPLIVTMDSNLGILDDACISIKNGVISSISKRSKLPEKSLQIVDLKHHILMPGFLDAHAHTPLIAYRRLANIASNPNYHDLLTGRRLSEETVYWAGLLSQLVMLLYGVTGVLDAFYNSSCLLRASVKSGIRAWALEVLNSEEPSAALKFLENAPKGKAGILLISRAAVDLFVSDQKLQQKLAEINGILAVDALSIDVNSIKSMLKMRSEGVKFHVVNPASDIGEAASVIYTPSRLALESTQYRFDAPDFSLGSGIRSLFSAPNVLEEARLSVFLSHQGSKPASVSSWDVLKTITVNPARSLDVRSGKLSPGHNADIVAVDTMKPGLRPLPSNVHDAIVYSVSREGISHVIVNGVIVVEDGRHKWLYPEGIIRKLESSLDKDLTRHK